MKIQIHTGGLKEVTQSKSVHAEECIFFFFFAVHSLGGDAEWTDACAETSVTSAHSEHIKKD